MSWHTAALRSFAILAAICFAIVVIDAMLAAHKRRYIKRVNDKLNSPFFRNVYSDYYRSRIK